MLTQDKNALLEAKKQRDDFIHKAAFEEIAFRFRLKNVSSLLDKHSNEILQGVYSIKSIINAVLELEAELLKQDEMFFEKIIRLERSDRQQLF